jgi:hypothetical protein
MSVYFVDPFLTKTENERLALSLSLSLSFGCVL